MTIWEEIDKLCLEGWTFMLTTRRSGWGADARENAYTDGIAGSFQHTRTDGDWAGDWCFGRTPEIAMRKALRRARGEKLDSPYVDSDT